MGQRDQPWRASTRSGDVTSQGPGDTSVPKKGSEQNEPDRIQLPRPWQGRRASRSQNAVSWQREREDCQGVCWQPRVWHSGAWCSGRGRLGLRGRPAAAPASNRAAFPPRQAPRPPHLPASHSHRGVLPDRRPPGSRPSDPRAGLQTVTGKFRCLSVREVNRSFRAEMNGVRIGFVESEPRAF